MEVVIDPLHADASLTKLRSSEDFIEKLCNKE